MNRRILLITLCFSTLALAGPREDAVAQALDLVKEAQDEAEDATGACKRALRDLDSLSDKLAALKKDATDKGLGRAKELAEDLSSAAKDDCKGALSKRVRKPLDKAIAQLEHAQEVKTAAAPPAQSWRQRARQPRRRHRRALRRRAVEHHRQQDRDEVLAPHRGDQRQAHRR